jgi:uncharacterized protein YjgD (DUF1641 family)
MFGPAWRIKMKSLAYIIGFDWIKNQTAKKVARILFNGGAVIAATNPLAAPLLAILGVIPSPEVAAAVTAILGALEAARNAIKHG